MSRRFITEAIPEQVPILVYGVETDFRRVLTEQIPAQYPDFSAVSFHGKGTGSLGLLTPPYAIVWVVRTEGEYNEDRWKVEEILKEHASKLYIVCDGSDLAKHASKEYPGSLVIQTVMRASEGMKVLAGTCVHEMLEEREQHSRGIRRVLPERKVQEEVASGEAVPEQSADEFLGDVHGDLDVVDEGRGDDWLQVQTPHREVDLPRPREPQRYVQTTIEAEEPAISSPVFHPTPLFSHLPSEREIVPGGKKQREGTALSRSKEQEATTDSKALGESHDPLAALFGKKIERESKERRGRSDGFMDRLRSFRLPRIGKGRNRLVVVFLAVAVLLVVSSLGVLYTTHAFFRSFERLQSTLVDDSMTTEEIGEAESALRRSISAVSVVRPVLVPIASLVGGSSYGEYLDQAIVLAQTELRVSEAVRAFGETESQMFSEFIGGNGDTFEVVRRGAVEADKAGREVQVFTAELANARENPHVQDGLMTKEGQQRLSELRKNLLATQHFLGSVPQLLGATKKQTYLLMIQNPLELRPTGGYFSAYGLLTIQNGKLIDLEINDTYVADDQLRGQVTPPPELTEHLKEQQWYLRDSNWSPDVPTAARQAEWFVEKELGVLPDGTISMNLYTIQELLDVTGPVELADYEGELVTSDNVFERVQTKSELSFSLNGEEKKKEYMTSVAEAVFIKLRELEPAKTPLLGAALTNSIESGDLAISVRETEVEKTLDQLGWSGKVVTPPCPQQFVGETCFVDTVYQVDTNVGVNRANYFVQKSMTHSVLLTPDAAAHSLSIRYTNTGVSSAWPSGTYKNYVRLYVPDFAQLNNVVVNQQPLSRAQVSQTVEFGKRVISFYIEVPVGATVNVTINYSTILTSSNGFSYALFTQKQPGIESYPLALSLHVQEPLFVRTIAPEAEVLDDLVQFDTAVDKHLYMAVELDR